MKKSLLLLCLLMLVYVHLKAGWNKQDSLTSENLNSISMVNPSEGWIVGDHGMILKYNGSSWISQNSKHSPSATGGC